MATCRECVPSAGCKQAVHKWSLKHGRGFFVGRGTALKRLTYTLPALLSCVEQGGQDS